MERSPADTDWRHWLDTYAPQFLLFARQKARCEADAQDLVQEAVLEASSRSSGSLPVPAMVYATIHRRAIDWARRDDRRRVREQAVTPTEQEAWFDTSVEDRERAQVVQSCLSQLNPIYRDVVVLKIWAGLTFAEIGETLDIPANTAASRYRYGLDELRKLQVLV